MEFNEDYGTISPVASYFWEHSVSLIVSYLTAEHQQILQ